MSGAAERTGRRVLLPIGLVGCITSLDATVLTNAIPPIRDDLGLSLAGMEWVITSYVLAFATLLLTGGRLVDLFGRRRMLVIGIAMFGIASVLVALSTSGQMMLVGRALQGVGASFVVPAVLAMIASDTEDTNLALSVYSMTIAGSLALGPSLGGLISDRLHWSWIFWLNVPVVVVTAAATLWAVPPVNPHPGLTVRQLVVRLDVAGLITSALVLCGATVILVELQEGHGFPVPLFVAVLAVTVLTVWVERRASYPLIDPAVLGNRAVAVGSAIQIAWGIGINGVFFFTPLFLQDVLGFSPTKAGLVFLPIALALVFTVPFTSRIVAAIGAAGAVTAGMLLVAAGLLWSVFVPPGAGFWHLVPGSIMLGIGSALIVPSTAAALARVEPATVGLASAVMSVAREVSGVLGIVLTGLVVSLREKPLLQAGVPKDLAFLAGYRLGLLAGACAALVGAVLAWRMLPRRGEFMIPAGGSAEVPLPPVPAEPVSAAPQVIDLRDRPADLRPVGHDLRPPVSAQLGAVIGGPTWLPPTPVSGLPTRRQLRAADARLAASAAPLSHAPASGQLNGRRYLSTATPPSSGYARSDVSVQTPPTALPTTALLGQALAAPEHDDSIGSEEAAQIGRHARIDRGGRPVQVDAPAQRPEEALERPRGRHRA